MHIQVIRNDHAPYSALVKIQDTMFDAEPKATWYITASPDGYYAHTSDGGYLDDGCKTVNEAVLLVVEDAMAGLFED